MPDFDCPQTAEYISATVYQVGQDKSTHLDNYACVFEYKYVQLI